MSNLDIINLLLVHYEQYSCMLVQDMVKLLYQNEFGSGHFIHSEANSLTRLTEEYHGLTHARDDKLFEDIGNGLCRLHLASINESLSLTTVNRFFVCTANEVTGSTAGFERKLDVLQQMCLNGSLSYSLPELMEYLAEYKEQGYPPVSHSVVYRENYRPAYRVVKSVFRDYFALFSRLDSLLKTPDLVTVAIDGNCAGGKSTLAALLADVYECNVFHMDDFFLPEWRKTQTRLNEAGGNVDYERFRDEVLRHLGAGEEFSYRPFCCASQELLDPITVRPKQLNVIEGAYSLHPYLRDSYDLRVFLAIEPELQSKRILERNGPAMHQRFVEEWIPLENRYFAELEIASKCDIVLETTADG